MWQGKDCEQVDPLSPLRQGDVLKRFVDGHPESFWLVVTADCDIAQNKLGDSGIACIQLVPLRQYLSEDHLSKAVSRSAGQHFRDLRQWIESRRRRADPDSAPLSDNAIADWITVAKPEEMCAALALSDPNDVAFLSEALSVVRQAHHCQQAAPNPRTMLRVLARFQKSPPKDMRQFASSLLARLQAAQLPDDLFFVSRIPSEESLGYLAKLRGISFVKAGCIADDIPSAKERALAYVRVARLAPTFKHGLAQQIGFMFARIGYPHEYELDRDEIFDLIAEELSGEFGVDHD